MESIILIFNNKIFYILLFLYIMKVIISSDIIENIKFTSKNLYIITTTINVLNNSTVEIEKDVVILLQINGGNLVFQDGSKLIGCDIVFGLCNENYYFRLY